ncbi:O-methyltransferase family 3 protein [Laetiporus sulphureus 93-53]|uniref:O-methyltransferase family 3 protein n=1 Tax=Laetiporus sulphureus 93-53 TaxID=1314785 RepID=A0A165H850_9APHY|nr:O-methyltransferase family 3 protein [Laetiporus sulphureus 93-53]KZT11378.1 O-methyltransferase family 3 protein [Laetiporus sulphureus 93-53]
MATSYTVEDWQRSDAYHNSFLIPPDEALERARKASDEAGLPSIAVSTAQGKFLNLLVRSHGAKRVLEVGTLGGYSTIWLARAVPQDGQVITCEISEKHAKVARDNIAHAGLASKVKLLLGPAAETLKTMQPDQPFDFIFIDADKPGNLTYLLEAKRLIKKGGVIIVDNVVRHGMVANPNADDDNSKGVRKLLEHLKTDKELDATTIGTVGEKGWDGFTYIVRL